MGFRNHREHDMLSETTIAWAKDRLETSVEDLLDDPYGVTFEGEETIEGKRVLSYGVTEYLDRQAIIAGDLGLDLEHLLSTMGTSFERERLEKLRTEHGI